ncbi:aldo/keto reductase [Pseudonocardia sp. MH-G8]|uniref:aldo/keto reductase n=1 Tax=Pseudonocardia sp. MH-G8 TaxID=1854588 RepID=UPI000BA16761|nr:aldo/keto reductase [Pseudonocardia sp. MH-G8]OZM83234.1 oxidoreductase [Pseudonocardia sp. MH-G8]
MLENRPLGTTGMSVPPLCIGTSAIGSIPGIYGYDVDADQALRTLRAVFAGPVRFIDTSNSYGGGESEKRIGAALRETGGLPEGFLLSTKTDPDAEGDFSGPRMRRSLEESMERLGLDHFRLVYLHDPERIPFEDATAPGGPVEVLIQMKDEGLIDHIGVAGGPVGMLQRFVELGSFEAVITHNRFTLLDRSAQPLLDQCAAAGVAVLNAAPFGGGMLVKGPDAAPRYAYRMASDPIRDSATRMLQACEATGVPLAAAALQFSLRDPRITSTIVGITKPERLDQTLELASLDIPAALWSELEALAPPKETWLR